MNLNDLEKSLDVALKDFADEMQLIYRSSTQEFATMDDINELSRQTFYAMNEFKKSIISYLKDN